MDAETLYRRVGQKLGIVAATQAMSAEDRSLIESAYESAHHQLDLYGLVSWSFEDDIPIEAGNPLVSVIAAQVVDEFGLEEPRRSLLIAEGGIGLPSTSLAERQLRKMSYAAGVEMDPEYF